MRTQALDTSYSTPRSSLLHQYQTLAQLSGEMADQARAGQWPTVVALGEKYVEAVEALKQYNHLTNEDRRARRELLVRILDNDTCIRHLLSPELERLNKLMGNLKRQQSVLHTYSSAILNP